MVRERGNSFSRASLILSLVFVLIGVLFVTDLIMTVLLAPLLIFIILPVPIVSLIFGLMNISNKYENGSTKEKRMAWIILGLNVLALALVIIGRFFVDYNSFGIPFLGS